ncbi:hypothetical protein [Verrucomicrobium sp. BvORR106]|uniref:hypothetical protein n=1 Tax=Verrucomicrobium sp. BvORR106 TaxID=1403819 RepID=UPI0005706EF3|nr:hypothetical protein [Verrucomicrobium sp. BvORR106]
MAPSSALSISGLRHVTSWWPIALLMVFLPSAFQSTWAREYLEYNGRVAYAPASVPQAVHHAVAAANALQRKPYRYGGGHRVLHDRGYDCSGTVSYVLYHAGLLRGPLASNQFRNYGAPGPGRYITLFVKDGHVFMSVCGLRLDTSDFGAGRGDGPRWRPTARSFKGYQLRHPPGL